MNESIYNLVPREYMAPEKQPMYRSKHDPGAPLTGSTFGNSPYPPTPQNNTTRLTYTQNIGCIGNTSLIGAGKLTKKGGALFGPSKLTGSPGHGTEEFLKRGTGNSPVSTALVASTVRYGKAEDRKLMPKRSDMTITGIKSNKNFITANAVEAILQGIVLENLFDGFSYILIIYSLVPKNVDTSEPNYLLKEDYGKVPAYLSQVKEEIRRENEMIESYVKRQERSHSYEPQGYAVLTEVERLELIDALKTRWDAVNMNYQKITHLVQLDSLGQIRRKENMEAMLKQLEMDISRLEGLGPASKKDHHLKPIR